MLTVFILSCVFLPFEYYECKNYEEITERKTKFEIFDGCYVKINNKWFDKNNLESVLIINELKKDT